MNKKKQYVKPEMQRVQLVPEEAVLGGCKATTGDGWGVPVGGSSCFVGSIGSCVANGS